ncbi:MAG: hypothetical protein LIO65_04140 [Odoribacter sp.]|nr:hypothetical protein [Odoribacter sp.]
MILCVSYAMAGKNANMKESSAKKVLVVGFEKDNIASNYYYDQIIAEKTNVPLDSIEYYFNQVIIDPLTSCAGKSNLQFIPCYNPQQLQGLTEKIQYAGEEENLRSDLSTLNEEDFEKLLSEFNADYLLVISQYYMKKELQPFPYLFHIVNFEVYDKNKDKKYEGRSYFNSSDLMPLEQYDKQYQKLAGKMMAQISKVAK